jgi:thiamine pyrophosphokinase
MPAKGVGLDRCDGAPREVRRLSFSTNEETIDEARIMKAVLVASGDPQLSDARWLSDADLVVAVDGGAAWLTTIGRRPDALVGDLDSVDPELVVSLEAAGVVIERHPTEKDASDTALALEYVRRHGATEAVVIGAFGGRRLDHEIANVLMLSADQAIPAVDLRLVRGPVQVRCVHAGSPMAIDARPGSLVSLLPVGGDAQGVVTSGLRYALQDEPLPPGSTRGVSNEVMAGAASVQLKSGMLLIIETAVEGEIE